MPSVEASTKGPSVIERILAVAVSRASATYRQTGVRQFTLICRAWISQEFNSSDGATVQLDATDIYDEIVHLPKCRVSLYNLARWLFKLSANSSSRVEIIVTIRHVQWYAAN